MPTGREVTVKLKALPAGTERRREGSRVLWARKQGTFPNVSMLRDADGSAWVTVYTSEALSERTSRIPRRLVRATAKNLYRLLDGRKTA